MIFELSQILNEFHTPPFFPLGRQLLITRDKTRGNGINKHGHPRQFGPSVLGWVQRSFIHGFSAIQKVQRRNMLISLGLSDAHHKIRSQNRGFPRKKFWQGKTSVPKTMWSEIGEQGKSANQNWLPLFSEYLFSFMIIENQWVINRPVVPKQQGEGGRAATDL